MFGDGVSGGPGKAEPESEISEEITQGAGAGDPGGDGGEGRRNAERTPELDQGGEAGQTQTPSPPDDVGVPSDEEIAEEHEEADAD